MASNRKTFTMDHPVIILFVIIAVVAAMGLAAEVLKPLALSVLLAFALTPISRLLEKRGVPRVPAVLLTAILAIGALGIVGFVVMRELDALAGDLPAKRDNIVAKIEKFRGAGQSNLTKVTQVASDVVESMDRPQSSKVQDVRVVEHPEFRKQLENAVGPYLEFLGVGSFVLILVLFMMISREDLSDRIIQLFGRRQITLTTRTMDDAGQRISRYLAIFATVNSCYGLIIGVGLWLLGVPYAVLWGFLAAITRFVPYVGPFIAFSLPTVFAFAHFPDWYHALGVVALFGVIETILNSFLEPVIYGRTTGVSALGLLVSAMFWTWLWGLMGLLLSTPLTVCLAVLGKYVPSLEFFSILLGEEAELPQDVRFYQRLLALDQDGATEIVEEALKKQPRAEVFQQILLPALSRAERDYSRGEIDDREQAFTWRIVAEVLDDLEGMPEISLGREAQEKVAEPIKVAGIVANDRSDELALKMLSQLLDPAMVQLQVIEPHDSPLALAEDVAKLAPAMVVLSHLPPAGLTNARYLVRRVHARVGEIPILVGRWGEGGDTDGAAERLSTSGANSVVFTLAEARDKILAAAKPKAAEAPTLSPALA